MSSFRIPSRLCLTADCPYCVDPQQHTDKDYDTECFDMAVQRAEGQCCNTADVGKYTPRQESRSLTCTNPKHYLCNHCFKGWQEASIYRVIAPTNAYSAMKPSYRIRAPAMRAWQDRLRSETTAKWRSLTRRFGSPNWKNRNPS